MKQTLNIIILFFILIGGPTYGQTKIKIKGDAVLLNKKEVAKLIIPDFKAMKAPRLATITSLSGDELAVVEMKVLKSGLVPDISSEAYEWYQVSVGDKVITIPIGMASTRKQMIRTLMVDHQVIKNGKIDEVGLQSLASKFSEDLAAKYQEAVALEKEMVPHLGYQAKCGDKSFLRIHDQDLKTIHCAVTGPTGATNKSQAGYVILNENSNSLGALTIEFYNRENAKIARFQGSATNSTTKMSTSHFITYKDGKKDHDIPTDRPAISQKAQLINYLLNMIRKGGYL